MPGGRHPAGVYPTSACRCPGRPVGSSCRSSSAPAPAGVPWSAASGPGTHRRRGVVRSPAGTGGSTAVVRRPGPGPPAGRRVGECGLRRPVRVRSGRPRWRCPRAGRCGPRATGGMVGRGRRCSRRESGRTACRAGSSPGRGSRAGDVAGAAVGTAALAAGRAEHGRLRPVSGRTSRSGPPRRAPRVAPAGRPVGADPVRLVELSRPAGPRPHRLASVVTEGRTPYGLPHFWQVTPIAVVVVVVGIAHEVGLRWLAVRQTEAHRRATAAPRAGPSTPAWCCCSWWCRDRSSAGPWRG